MLKMAAIAMVMTGCAWTFQEHEPQPYVVDHEPRCTTTPGWWLIDGISVGGDVALAIGSRDNGALLGVGLTSAAIDLAAMATGTIWASECRDARRAYDERPEQLGERPRPRPAPRGWCFDVGGGEFACYRTQEACAAEIDRAVVARGECERHPTAPETPRSSTSR